MLKKRKRAKSVKSTIVGIFKILSRSGTVETINKTAKRRLNIISFEVRENRSGVDIDLVEVVVVLDATFFVFPEIDLTIAQITPDRKTSTQTKAIATTINPSIVLLGKIVLLAKIKKSNKNTITELIIK